jgi:ketosteroid isomerase-like protein
MPIQKPEEVLELVAQTINSGDVDAQMAIYEPDAYFILSRARPSDWHPGHPGTLHWLLGNETNVNFGFAVLHQTGDIALIHDKWHLTGTGEDGNPVDMSGQTAAVLRRQPDGNWLVIIGDIFSID